MRELDNVIQSLTTISALFTGRHFRVPDYQRGYAWESAQVDALLEDLKLLNESGATSSVHYTGTLVLVPSGKEVAGNQVYDIVDGQQRLTSVTMLLNILINKCQPGSREQVFRTEWNQKYVCRGEKALNEEPVLTS